jgi:hypothetical protein
MLPSRHGAFGIPGHARAADVGAQFVDRASGCSTDLAIKRHAPISLAPHS